MTNKDPDPIDCDNEDPFQGCTILNHNYCELIIE